MGSALRATNRRSPSDGSASGVVILWLFSGLLAASFAAPERPDARSADAHALAMAENAEIRLGELLGTLRPVAARLRAGETLEWKQFDRLLSEDASAPLLLVGWAPRVPPDRRAAFESEASRDTYRSMNVFELDARGARKQPSKMRDHFPLTFGHPHPKADSLLGWDLASEPDLAAAIRNARQSHTPQIVTHTPLALDATRRQEPAPAHGPPVPPAQKGPGSCLLLAKDSGSACQPHLVVVVPVERNRRQGSLQGVLVGLVPLARLTEGIFSPAVERQVLPSVAITQPAHRANRPRLRGPDLGLGRASFTLGGAPWTVELRLPREPGLAARFGRR